MGHDYVLSMAVSIIGEWLKVVPFLLGDEQLIMGRGWQFFKINILAVKHLNINILLLPLCKTNYINKHNYYFKMQFFHIKIQYNYGDMKQNLYRKNCYSFLFERNKHQYLNIPKLRIH